MLRGDGRRVLGRATTGVGIALLAAMAAASGCRLVAGISDDVRVATGDSAAEASADAGPPGDGACPSGPGPAMKLVPGADGGTCVDTTEVTYAQFQQFVVWLGQSQPYPFTSLIDASDPVCGPGTAIDQRSQSAIQATDSQRDPRFPSERDGAPDPYPVVSVNYCEAKAFCAWANKRLCGGAPGATDDAVSFMSASVDEWTNACTAGGAYAYGYGVAFDPTKCNTVYRLASDECLDPGDPSRDAPYCAPTKAGELTGCTSPDPRFAGIYDLIGNAYEWTDVCGDAGCLMRGGSFSQGEQFGADPVDQASCASTWGTNPPYGIDPATNNADMGLRCCADPG
jgi:formylglycine-generating enzyme required for sulfatase activity